MMQILFTLYTDSGPKRRKCCEWKLIKITMKIYKHGTYPCDKIRTIEGVPNIIKQFWKS